MPRVSKYKYKQGREREERGRGEEEREKEEERERERNQKRKDELEPVILRKCCHGHLVAQDHGGPQTPDRNGIGI